ncbi:CheR family methyltransferase [Deinococcus pimensis]|uniref:CheR family methyltransferase n=1 Tax=Deinococcus pimensis TaxID=309888 RepID=UPI000488FD81|nr:protein-glutamate O-methyltransferase CheR [Deinococcus pimensis]
MDFSPLTTPPDVEALEIDLLLEGVHRRYGFDFRGYASATLHRRVQHCVRAEGLATVSALQERVLRDAAAFERLVSCLSISVTEMFRDPPFYAALRERIIPTLRTYPFIRVWHAGCATGEEVYSMAILLAEADLLGRARLYATDISAHALQRAQDGIYSAERLDLYARNYREAGGTGDFASYFTQQYDRGIVRADLRHNIIWGQHNLVTDGSFNEFHVILCRNVLIYFDRDLQERVYGLLDESLAARGTLGLGRHETLDFTPLARRYQTLDPREKLYRRTA